MARLRKRHLPHRITIKPVLGEGADGVEYGDPVDDIPAYVEQKSRLVIDRRDGSPTANKEITSTTVVVLLLENDTLPASLVTVWAGTPREREAEVIDSAYGEYRGTPSHVELYLT